MHADPDGRAPRRIDAIIFSDDGTVTFEYADPAPEHPVDEGTRLTVPYQLTPDIEELVVVGLLETANDVIALAREHRRKNSGSPLPGR